MVIKLPLKATDSKKLLIEVKPTSKWPVRIHLNTGVEICTDFEILAELYDEAWSILFDREMTQKHEIQ